MVYFNSCNISMIMTHVNVHSGYSDKKGKLTLQLSKLTCC